MSSTASISPIRDRPWLLKTLIAIYISILTTNLFLLLQLIAHMAATQGKENFGMPPLWRKGFVRQAVGGSKMFTWVVVFLLVSLRLRRGRKKGEAREKEEEGLM
jgi:hypothetical protein